MAGSVVIFSAGRLHEKTVFNEEARKIYQTMKHAREMALLERRDTAFRLDPEVNTYWIDSGGGSSDVRSLPRGLVITGKDVLFFPKGNSSGGSIKIQNAKGQEYNIEIDPVLGTPSIKRF